MNTGIEALTTATLALALDAASLRHKAIASNIANVDTQAYVPVRVSFEDQLESLRASLERTGSAAPAGLAEVRPRLAPALDAAGQPETIQLDAEVARLAENTVRYQALLKGLNRHFALLNMAINEGRK